MIVGGIDAGGSKTNCIIKDYKQDKVLATATGGPANYQVEGTEKVYKEIKNTVIKALDKAAIKKLSLLGIGIAGAGREKDRKTLFKYLSVKSVLENRIGEIHITDDGVIALLGATGGKKGMILIAGTGSIAYGLKKSGEKIRSGGWGPIIGDEGSGFWMGLKAIQTTIKTLEGRAKKISLSKLIKNKLQFNNINELIPFIYEGELPRKEIAALAPYIIKQAKKGDQNAEEILTEVIEELNKLILSIKKRIDYNLEKTAVAGGLFSNKYFYKKFESQLQNKYSVNIYKPEYSPAQGAIFFALKKGNNL